MNNLARTAQPLASSNFRSAMVRSGLLGSVYNCPYRKPKTAVDRLIIAAMGDFLRLIWYAVAGLCGRAQPCKPKFSPFAISSMCCGGVGIGRIQL